MTRQHITIASITIALCVLVSVGAHAQTEGRDNGFYLGLRVASSHIPIDNETAAVLKIDEDGAGLGVLAGYSFNPVFSLEMELTAAVHPTSRIEVDASYASIRMFAHYRFRPGQALRPFIKGGLGAYGFGIKDQTNSVTVTGGGVPIAGGADYFFTHWFSLGLDLTYNIIEYTQAEIRLDSSSINFDIDSDSAQSALSIAFQFYF